MKKQSLIAEVKRRVADGFPPWTMAAIIRHLATLGYKLDRSMDARSQHRYLTGKWAGLSHPGITTGIREADTGLTFCNIHARRDANFQALQAIRGGAVYAVVRGHIFEL